MEYVSHDISKCRILQVSTYVVIVAAERACANFGTCVYGSLHEHLHCTVLPFDRHLARSNIQITVERELITGADLDTSVGCQRSGSACNAIYMNGEVVTDCFSTDQ